MKMFVNAVCFLFLLKLIRFFHQSHNTIFFFFFFFGGGAGGGGEGGVFAFKQWIFISLKHDIVPRVNNL